MIHMLLVNLQDPTYEILLLAAALMVAAVIYVARTHPEMLRAAILVARLRAGTIELENQGWSGTITIILLAVGGVIGYTVWAGALTATCVSTMSKIATANDLRMQYGQGYMANGSVTLAAMTDANGNTYGFKSDPRDWAASSSAKYTWTATQTNGDWSYTVQCPGTHAGWTTILLSGGGVTHTQLKYSGPDGGPGVV